MLGFLITETGGDSETRFFPTALLTVHTSQFGSSDPMTEYQWSAMKA